MTGQVLTIEDPPLLPPRKSLADHVEHLKHRRHNDIGHDVQLFVVTHPCLASRRVVQAISIPAPGGSVPSASSLRRARCGGGKNEGESRECHEHSLFYQASKALCDLRKWTSQPFQIHKGILPFPDKSCRFQSEFMRKPNHDNLDNIEHPKCGESFADRRNFTILSRKDQ